MATELPGKLYGQFAPEERLTLLLHAMARDDAGEVARLWESCRRREYRMADAAFADRAEEAQRITLIVCQDLRHLSGKLAILNGLLSATEHLLARHRIVASLAFMEGAAAARGEPQLHLFAKGWRKDDGDGEEDAADEGDQEGADADEEDSTEEDDGDGEAADEDANEEERVDVTAEQAEFARRWGAVDGMAEGATGWTGGLLRSIAEEVGGEFVTHWAAFDRFCRKHLGVTAEEAVRAWGGPVADDFAASAALYKHLAPDGRLAAVYEAAMDRAWERKFGTGCGGG